MASVIMFVAACLIWQSIKDFIRWGKKRRPPVVRMAGQRAECGCEVLNSQVTQPCIAHLTMMSALKKGR